MLDLSQLSFDFGALPRWEPFRSLRELKPSGTTPAGPPSPLPAAAPASPPGDLAGRAGSGLAGGNDNATADDSGGIAGVAADLDADGAAIPAGAGTIPPSACAPQPILDGRDATLEDQARGWLHALEMPGGARLLTVTWNARLRSTAGYARYPSWAIELNPRLAEFEGQVECTLKHELAHLIAYHRAGRRRIEPHGREWRAACADLGIPDEKACHRLPLPRNAVERKLTYACPACHTTVQRVRKFRRPTACLHCCNRHAGGRYDGRFRLVLVGG